MFDKNQLAKMEQDSIIFEKVLSSARIYGRAVTFHLNRKKAYQFISCEEITPELRLVDARDHFFGGHKDEDVMEFFARLEMSDKQLESIPFNARVIDLKQSKGF